MPPAAVIFDHDGLTLDTEQAWTRAEGTLFERYGRRFTDDHKRDLLGSSREVAAVKLERILELPGRGSGLMDELHDIVMEEVLRGAPPMPGARELVAELRAYGVPVGLASNSPRVFVDRALGVAGMAEAFDVTVAGDEVPAPKPAAGRLPRGRPRRWGPSRPAAWPWRTRTPASPPPARPGWS